MFDRANLGNNLMKFGMGTATLGITYAMMKDSMRGCGCNSVFGGGFGMPMGGMMGMGMGMPMGGLFSNPMMSMGMGMNSNPLLAMNGGGMGSWMSSGINPGMYNPFGIANQQQKTIQKMNNAKADAVAQDEDVSLGKALEKATKGMADEKGKPIKGKEFKFVSDEWADLSEKKNRTSDENEELVEEYKESVEDLARSYLAQIDTNGGNRHGDGYITAAEFADYNLANNSPEGVVKGSSDEAKYIKASQIAFDKLDINKDGVVDWKEMASMIHAVDTEQVTGRGNLGKQNGVISAEDLDAFNTQLMNERDTAADKKLQDSYSSLFLDEE